MSAELVDESMNEIRRNWNTTLQDEVRAGCAVHPRLG